MRKYLSISLLAALAFLQPAYSQFTQEIIFDAGSSAISSGAYGRIASVSAYRISDYEAHFGLQTTFGAVERNILSGLFLDLSGDYHIKDFPITATVFFRRNPYTPLVNETNFGLLASHRRDHIEVNIGYNSRIYSLKNAETDPGEPNQDRHIFEWRNFMYKGILWIKPMNHIWNLGGSLTNYDHFLIQQETNPMLTGLFLFNINEDMGLYCEMWYQGAGMLNLSANHYGFYIRAGFRWEIK